MINPDRPSGFRFVKTLSGAPMVSVMRSVGVTDGEDMFKGDLINLTANLGKVAATADTTFLGIAVGFGKRDPASGEFAGAYNPDVLTTIYYDDGASDSADWRVFYVPLVDAIIEAQSDTALGLAIGDPCDLLTTTAGVTATGISGQQVGANTNSDMYVVEIPPYPDNDSTLANTRYQVTVAKDKLMFA